jgi:hypothetical protein
MPKQKIRTTKYWNGDKLVLVGSVDTWSEATHITASLKLYMCEDNPNGGFNVYVRIPQI